MNPDARVDEALKSLFSSQVEIAIRWPRDDTGARAEFEGRAIDPREAALVEHAVERRRAEFFAGRAAAHAAIARLGADDGPILAGPRGAPQWPTGVVGSISHGAGVCVAVVARSRGSRTLGVDIEPWQPLESTLWDSIWTVDERERFAVWPDRYLGYFARLSFSAKECLYKAQFPLTRSFLEFHDVDIRFDLERRTFEAVALTETARTALATVEHWTGRYALVESRLVTSLEVPEPPEH